MRIYAWKPGVCGATLGLCVLGSGCGGSEPTEVEDPAPIVSAFAPTEGAVGTAVTITGEHFSPTAGENVVTFGGASAAPAEASSTQLSVDVPPGATSGAVSVTVDGRTGTSPTAFTVISDIALPRTGLIVFYPFSGSVADSSGNEYDAVNNGASLFTDRHGNAGRALSFWPPDHLDAGEIPEVASLGSAFTVSVWVRPSSAAVNASGSILGDFNPGSAGFHLTHGAGRRVAFEIAGVGTVAADGLLTSQEWSNVTVTYDGAKLKLYHDGGIVQTVSATGDVTAPGWSLQVGKERWANTAPSANFFDGELDDLAIWGRVLSEAEVMDVFLQTDTR